MKKYWLISVKKKKKEIKKNCTNEHWEAITKPSLLPALQKRYLTKNKERKNEQAK